jgi:Arc/MetJ-type ribon-helix-helix transcriptional regulator
MDKQRTIRLSKQDLQAIAAIRDEYGLTSDSEALRFALHTLWREIKRQGNPTQASQTAERPSHPTP